MTSRKQLAINQRALYDDAVKNKMFWNATPSFQEFQRRLQNPKYVQTVQANYRAHGRSGDAFDTLSGFRDYFCVSDEDRQESVQRVDNMIANTKARLAGQQRYNKLKQFQDKHRDGLGFGVKKPLFFGVKTPFTNDNVVREPLTGRYLTSDGAEYAQEFDAVRAQNHIDETGKRYTEAVKRGDIPSAFEVRDKDGNYALMEDLGVKPGVHVTEKGKQQQLAGLVNTRKNVEEQYNALYRKLEEDFKRSAPFSINTHSQYGIDDNDMRLQAYLNSNAQYRRLKAQLHQLDNAIGVGKEAVKGRAEEIYVKNAKGMLGYAYRDLKSFGASALRGLWNAVSDVSTWDLGLQDLQDNMTLYTTVKKARQKGYKNLNDEERQMLDVAAKTGAYTAENQQYLGRGYKAGNVTGESLPFMVEMALNPASGLGEAVMSKYMRNAIAKYGKEAVRKEAWKYVTKKCGYRVAGDVLGAALMTGTTGSARTLADTYDRLTGDIKSTYDSEGKIVYDGTENEEKGILKAYLKAFGATAIENHSEFVGEYFNPLLKGVGTLTMKGWKKVNAKSANAFLDNLKDMGSTSTAKWLGNLFDKTQWHGTIGEYAEEVVGNIENALLVGDSTLDTKEGTGVFNLDQNIDTFLGVSLMGGFFSTLKTGAYVRDKVKGERKILMQQSLDLDNSIRYALGADPRLADKWKEWRVALAQGTDEEKKQALKEISENTNGNIKKAMYDYSANAQKLAGMDKATQGAIEDGTITPEQAQRDADIEQAHEEGLAAEGTARHDIQQEHQLKENSLARMLGISAEQLDRMEDEDIESMTGQNDALDTAIYDYQTSRERYQGVIDRATDEVEQAGIDAAHQIDLYTDHSTGQIRPCVIKGNNGKDDYQGYIVNGNIATHPDGAIDVSGSDKMILYFDPETGKIEHGDASTFASLGESADATVARQQAIDEAKQQAAQAQSRDIDGGVGEDGNVSEAMPTFPQSSDQEERNAADFDIGQVVNAETGEVIPVSFEGLAEGENAYLTGGRPDGKTKDRLKVTIVDAEGNVTNRVMKRGNVQVDGRMSAEDFRNAYEEAVSSRMAPEADINEQENNVDEEGVVAGDAAPSADKAATSEEEGAASEPAVRDKNGNPIYDKMPISATIADLYDGALDDAEIDGFVSAQIAEAEKAVEKMEKKKPKVGTDKAKYLADKKAWEEGLQEAQRKVQYWQDVKAEVEKITTPEDARGYEEELNGDAAQTAYRNGSDAAAYGAREVTAEFMQSGDVKITPESYRKETGFGAAEQRAMVGKISKGGKSIDKLAEDLEVFDRENYNGMYFGGDSSVAKDAILDYLSSPDSRKGVKKMQSEAEREYVEAYEAERDRYYQEKYHMSYEEYLVYSSQEMPELLRKYSNFDEQLFLERYADEIEAALQKREEQLKQEENGKEGNVSAGEESGHGRSNQVQSGERTDDIGRGEVGKDSAGEVGPRHEGVVESEAALGSGGSTNQQRIGRVQKETRADVADQTMTHDEAIAFIAAMENRAEVAPSVDLSIENWDSLFGLDGIVNTPIGKVKMGDNQFTKMMREDRHGKLGMVKPTLENPDAILEDASKAKAGDTEERPSSYIFVKAFKKSDGSRYYYFTSITVSKDGLEVVVSNQEKRKNAIANLLSKDKLVWKHADDVSDASDVAQGLYSSQGNVSDLATEGTDAPQTSMSNNDPTSSGSKDTNNTDTKQENEEKSAGGEKEPMSPTPAMIDRMIEEQRVDDVSELLISSELKKAAEGIAEAFGMKVVYLKKVFIKSDDPAVEDFEGNGFVRNGVIYLSLKEADIAQFTFGHELLHQLKQIDADSYMRIRQKVIDVMGRKAFEMEVKARQMTYANVPGYTLFEDYAEEVIADTLGDIITHTDMLPDIARSLKENPSLLDRFLNVVDNVRQYFRGKIGGAFGDLVNDIRNTYEMTARQGAELGLSTPLKITEHTKFSLKDNQGNPLNQDGTLKLDKIKSVDELTDEDFLHPTRNVELPSLPKKIADAIGTEGKPVVIKKNIFERNYMRHKDVTPDLSKIIFKSALYNPDLYGQNQKKTRPYNWVLINTKDEKGNNRTVLLEVNPNKDNVEIVHWHFIDERGLKKIRKQVDREDGQLLILPSDKEEVGALSDPTVNLSAANIDNSSETAKESEGKDRQHYASLGVSRQFGDGEREQQTANERLKGEGYQYMARDKFSLRLAEAKNNTDKNPSQAQKESGNYRKGHIRFGGYNYTIENPQGSYRSGVDENGKKWKQKMNNTYGYILGIKGKDGDHLDMFINDKADLDSWNGNVYVVDQVFPDGSFDEHKVMYGFGSEEDARKAYLSNYEQGWQGLGNITGVSKEDFDRWLEKSGRKTKAFSEYKNVKSESAESPKTGAFGTVYTQFRGKAQEAFDFLASHGSGDLLGVFHREGVGDIDAVWGDKGGGLDHIIRKHIGDGKSFHNIVEAANVIDDIIKTGSKAFENGDKIVFKKGSKLVTIRKNVRNKGKKIADKNWVLTAYDELSADGDVSAIAPVNQGQAARTTGKSQRKDTTKPSYSQKKNVKSNKKIPFSLKNDRTLAGVHNITEEKLRKALKLGGFANPSVAVIDTSKNGHEKFGEISLIAPSALVDKESGRTAGTWTTDAYTQRYPSVERQMSDKGYEKFCKWVDGLDFTDSEKAEIKRQATDALEDNREPAWELMYLKEKGIDIKAYSSDVNYAWEPVVETYGSVDDVLKAMESDAELDEKVRKLVKAEIASPVMNTIRNKVRHQIREETGNVPSPVNPAVRKRVREIFDNEYAPKLFDENGQVKSEDVRKVVGEMLVKYNDTKRFSFQKAKSKASTYVHNNGMYTDYLRWQEEKLEDYGTKGRIFRGYRNDGTRRYSPETLENVSKAMSEDADGETNGSEYTSFGSFIAKLAPHVDSTEEMRSSKDKLSSSEEEKKEFYDKWEDTYYALAKELYNDVFYGEKRLHDIVLQKDPKRYAKKEYGITLSASFMKNLDALKKAIREDLKSPYFETKFERPVHLDEFAAAVVPNDLGADVRKMLEESGIALYGYDPAKKGDRSRAFNEAIISSDNIRFSLRQEPAPKVTKKGYAVFIYKKLKNGGYKLVPKMLSNDPGAPAQTWLNADTGYMKRDENGEPLQNTNGRASVSVNGSQAGGNKSNKLAWRPGKHLAMYPNASQFKSPDGTIPKDVIFFEVEYAADPDLHKQYQRNAWELGMNDNGQYRNNQGGLPYIPKDSYYLYRTNSISEGATPMIITGAYKINRALTDAEAKELNQNAGGMWCPRKGGDLTEEKLKDMGLDDKGLKKMTESFDMDTIKESHDESDEARLLPGYKSREINWEDKDLIHSIEENGQDINDYRDGYVAPEHSEEPTIRFSLDKDKGTVASPSKPSKAEAVLRDAVIDRLRENGMEVITDVVEGQKVLDEANGDVREMSFGEPYDYEAYPLGRVEPNLADREVMVVRTDADHGFMNYKEAKAWAKQHVAKVYNNEETGGKGDVRISNAAIDKFMSQSAVDKSDGKDVHMSVLKVLPEVLKNSIDVETHPDFLKGADGKRRPENGMNKDVLVHRCYGAVSIDGKPYRVKITLKEEMRNKSLPHNTHSYEATKIELLAGTLVKPKGDNPNTNNSISAAKLLENVVMSYNPGEKVLDASEKRSAGLREQRVYHGSGADGVRFFRTANGEAYGFTVGGKIYVDPRIATSETPVHEYAHLWASALRSGNVEEWQNVVGLMKDSKVWDEVKGRYPELKTDDEIADEVIATYSGRRGAERLREEQRKIAEGDGGVFEKAEAISALEHVKRALKMFWKGVADFLHIHYKSAEEVADRVMKDLLEGVDPRKMGDGVDRQRYASLGVSRALGKEAAEGEPRWASLGLSEQQLDGDDTIRFSLNYDKWNREMASWLKRNRLPKNAQRPVVPQREAGESDLHFAGRLAKYNQDKALWNTAPKYEGHLSSGMTARGEFNYELQRGSVLARIAAQDSMLAIRKAQEAIARHSGLLKVGTFEDAYMAENNSHGKAKNEFEQYDQEYLEPLRKWFNVMMKRLDGSYNNVTNYMIAKHGLERNAHMAFMAALEAEAKKAIGNTQPDAKRLRAQMVHDAYRQYKADSRRLINDADYEAGKYDYAQWRRTDDAIRKSYCSNYESFRYDKGGVVRDYAGLSSLFLNETDFEEKAAELCADIESKNGHETSELWDAVRQATRQILKNSHDAGMMSDETYDYVRGMYEHYIPLRGWNDSAADEVWDYAGGGRGVFNAALKEAHGRQSLADDPVAYIMNMAESGFLVNNRNWVKQHFLTMAMNHPTDLLTVSKAWYVKTKDQFGNEVWIPASPNIPVDETDPAVIEAALNAFQTKMEQMEQSGDATQQRGSLNIEYPQTKSEEREHEVRVMKDGEEYVVYVNGDPQLAQALNNTRAMRVREHEGNFEKACAWLGRKMAAVYTSLSPLFVPSNWARDTTMTLASTAIREDARYNWLLRTKFMRPDVQMRMFGLVKEYQNGKLREKVKSRTATKTEENFWNFMINGGETGFVSTMDVDAFREKIQRDLKDMGRTRLNPVKVGHTIADSVEYINRVIEDSNRFAIYQTSIEYGRGIEEAVQDAKNVTLNFNRKGTGEMGMSAIRQLYLFINPAIQSLQTLGALAKDHKAKFTAVTSAWMASGMLVPLFNELMFNLASAAAGGGGDDDDEFNPKDEYWKFSSFDRRNNCILWIPFTHNFIKIPLAPEFRGFYGIGDMVASAMWGGENAKESWSNYAADLMGQIIDLSPLDPVSYDGNVLVSLMPNAIRPLVEIAQNVTFTGKPIYRESDFNKYDPSFKKAYAGTPDFLLRYSKWMNSIGNKYPEAQQGPVEQTAVGRYANNPAVIDHLLKSYLGGMYTLGSQIAGAITKASDEETRKDFKTADIPFFSKFVANPNDRPQSKNKGDAYWQDFEKYQRSSHTLGVIRQDARKTGNFSVLEDFYKSEEYKEMKEYEPKAKQRKEEQKYERWKEEGNADLYQPHQQTGEDVYKRHSTPADDFEDTKASILYQKIRPAKDIFDLADINTPSGMDTFNKYYDLAGKVEEAHSVKKEMNAIVKSFVNDEHKTTFDPEKMKEYRALRKQYLQLVEDGNRMFEKIKAQRN